ncbi:MAG: hypothetical protein WCV59_02785 [Parcubacteria group bacterium]|jgi:hypothetical protein
MQARIKGFVVGADRPFEGGVRGKKVWKVRVKDESHEDNGKKFEVAEGHWKRFFSKGLDVTFELGNFQEGGQAVRKAINVKLLDNKTEAKELPMEKAKIVQDPDTLYVLITECRGELSVYFTGFETEEEAVAFFIKETGENEADSEKVVCFIPFNIYDWTEDALDPDIVNGFAVVRSLVGITSAQEALEKMMTVILRSFATRKEE